MPISTMGDMFAEGKRLRIYGLIPRGKSYGSRHLLLSATRQSHYKGVILFIFAYYSQFTLIAIAFSYFCSVLISYSYLYYH
eukprot:Pgem_evm1s3426